MSLADIITALEAEDPTRILVNGFNNPHSYRGFYDELAFEPAADVSIGDMLTAARSAVNATYQGYKGGWYTMDVSSDCWLSMEGSASGEFIGSTLLRLLLQQDAPAIAVDPWPTIAALVAWLDHANGTGETETAMRLLKLTEEIGEVSNAYIGVTGQNVRKGVTHTRGDVADELCDVAVTALVALHRFSKDPAGHFAAKLQRIADRSLTAAETRTP